VRPPAGPRDSLLPGEAPPTRRLMNRKMPSPGEQVSGTARAERTRSVEERLRVAQLAHARRQSQK
jgi:hypothetical protein